MVRHLGASWGALFDAASGSRELPQAALPLFRHGRAGGVDAQSESEEKPVAKSDTETLTQTTPPESLNKLEAEGKSHFGLNQKSINNEVNYIY
jgi:hypothetical protein